MASILIVDDEIGVRTFLTTLLGSRSHRVLAAGDVSQAIAVFHAEKPELVITDIVMPDRDGFEFIRELRADRLGKTTPILIHTALSADRSTHALAQACGVQFVLEKPASATLILETVERALGSAPAAVEMPAEFERDHLRLLNNHLGRKLHDLQEEITRCRQLEAALRKSQERSTQTEQRLRVVSRNVIETQETERRYLARELHDEIGQVLSAISVNLKIVKTKVDASASPRLQESIHLVDEAIQQVRNLSLDLRPPVLDEFGLEAALRWYADRVSERTGLRIHVTARPAPTEIPADVRNTCFRVAQEALTNVVRHAVARTVWIELLPEKSDIQLSVRDDGKGLEVAAARQRAAQGDSFGLLCMQERIELLGGSFELESKPGQGASVRMVVPLANADPSTQEDKEP